MAGLCAEEPCLNDTVHLVYPWHFNGISGNVEHDDIVVDGSKGLDHLVLSIRKGHCVSVASLCVLSSRFVEASEEKDHISIRRLCHCVCDKLFLAAWVFKVDACVDVVVFAEEVTYISSLVYDFSLVADGFAKACYRSALILRLKR